MSEILYNGIELPEAWPPVCDPTSREPMRTPYLYNPPKVIPIDVGRQLFVDNFLIELTNMSRTFHQPVKYHGNPVLWPDSDVEKNDDGIAGACPKGGGIWYDSEMKRFRMWYEGGWLGVLCYAESEDGINWVKPKLDAARPGTNQLLDMPFDSSSVLVNPHAKDGEPKYHLFVRAANTKAPGSHAHVLTSHDGIHWSDPIQTGPTGDRSTMFYNPFRRKWIYSMRRGVPNGRGRAYREHADFIEGSQWTETENSPTWWTGADDLDQNGDTRAQLYNLDAVAYESVMLGLFQILTGPPNEFGMISGHPKNTQLTLATSRDGFHWYRPDRRMFIPSRRVAGSWEYGYVQSSSTVCVIVGDEVWFYYIGYAGKPHARRAPIDHQDLYADGATGIAKMRRDGFASMDVGAEKGVLTTRPLLFTGSSLFVNANTMGGQLTVECLGDDDQPIAGFEADNCVPYVGSSVCAPMLWKDGRDLSQLANRPVRLRFHMTRGSLYAFWVSRDATGRSGGYLAGGGPGYAGYVDE